MRKFSALIGALVVLVVIAPPLGASGTMPAKWPPKQYRFTGWISAGVGYAPHHAFVEGDGVVLHFQDAANEQPTRYRVCWARTNGTNQKCWNRVARSFRISSIRTLGPLLHFGTYQARWYVSGVEVASWPFSFSAEHSNHP